MGTESVKAVDIQVYSVFGFAHIHVLLTKARTNINAVLTGFQRFWNQC